jgi:hypothetical protein
MMVEMEILPILGVQVAEVALKAQEVLGTRVALAMVELQLQHQLLIPQLEEPAVVAVVVVVMDIKPVDAEAQEVVMVVQDQVQQVQLQE